MVVTRSLARALFMDRLTRLSLRLLAVLALVATTAVAATTVEAHSVPGFDVSSWVGVGVRAGTPKEICDKIEAGAKEICKDPKLIERLAGLVGEPIGDGADAFATYIVAERKKWGKLIGDLKIKAE